MNRSKHSIVLIFTFILTVVWAFGATAEKLTDAIYWSTAWFLETLK